MTLRNADLERMADDMYKGRLLGHSVYCGNCGYNLKTLPYKHTCPECGNEYNARPRVMKGIFLPQEAEWPIRDALATILCVFCVLFFGRDIARQKDAFWLTITALVVVLGCMFAVNVYMRTMRVIKSIGIARRIVRQESQEDA